MNVEEKMPMDDDFVAPTIEHEPQGETQEQKDQRARDEAGRFAKADPKPDAGKADPNMRDFRLAQERDQARRDAEDAKAAHAALQKRLDDMAALAKGEPDPEAPADPLKPILEKVEAIGKRFADQDEAREQERIHTQVMTYADQDEARFRAATPDFPDATVHYIKSRLSEMQALGYDQQQAEAALQQEANALLYQCAQSNRSPAEALYAMAKARGYAPGANPTPSAEPAPQPFTIEQPASGRRSMGGGGSPAAGAVTAAQIAAMEEADYMAFRATPEGKRAIQRVMGG